MIKYCLGFAFDPNKKQVALILKNRGPVGMAGKFNGLGGKIEADEAAYDAMKREFGQEAGLYIDSWELFAIFCAEAWQMHVYMITIPDLRDLKSMTDELVQVFPVDDLPPNLVECVSWLIPMALEPKAPDTVMTIGYL